MPLPHTIPSKAIKTPRNALSAQVRYFHCIGANLCSACHEPAKEGSTKCQFCLDAEKSRQKTQREDRKAKGLCRKCGLNPSGNRAECEACRTKRNNRLKLKRISRTAT